MSWLQSSTFVFIASGVVNVSNFAYHLLMVRWLRAEDYAILNALLALSMIVSVPAMTIQAAISRHVAQAHAQDAAHRIWPALRNTLLRVGLMAAAFFALAAAGHQWLAEFLQIPDSWLAFWWGLVVAFLLVTPALVGGLQGLQEFTHLGVNLMSGGVARLIGGIGLVWLGFGVHGAVLGLVLAAAATCVLGAVQLRLVQRRRHPQVRAPSEEGREPVEFQAALEEWFSDLVVAIRPPWWLSWSTVAIALAVTAYTSLTNTDVALAKHYLTPALAGDYAVAAMISRIILFLPSAVAIVLFPKVAHATARGEDARPLLRQMLALTAGLSGTAAAVCMAVPNLVTRIITGAPHEISARLVPWLAAAMVGLALANIVLTYVLAAGALRHVAAFVAGAVLHVVAIFAWHETPWHIAEVETGIAAVMAAYALALCWGPSRWVAGSNNRRSA